MRSCTACTAGRRRPGRCRAGRAYPTGHVQTEHARGTGQVGQVAAQLAALDVQRDRAAFAAVLDQILPERRIDSKYCAGASAVAVRATGRAMVSMKPSKPTVTRRPAARRRSSRMVLTAAPQPLRRLRHSSSGGSAARWPVLHWNRAVYGLLENLSLAHRLQSE